MRCDMAATEVIHFSVRVQLNPRWVFPAVTFLRFPSTPPSQSPPVGRQTSQDGWPTTLPIGRTSSSVESTSSGKTTLANILTDFIPDDERIVLIEGTAEIQILKPNVLRFEARRE